MIYLFFNGFWFVINHQSANHGVLVYGTFRNSGFKLQFTSEDLYIYITMEQKLPLISTDDILKHHSFLAYPGTLLHLHYLKGHAPLLHVSTNLDWSTAVSIHLKNHQKCLKCAIVKIWNPSALRNYHVFLWHQQPSRERRFLLRDRRPQNRITIFWIFHPPLSPHYNIIKVGWWYNVI